MNPQNPTDLPGSANSNGLREGAPLGVPTLPDRVQDEILFLVQSLALAGDDLNAAFRRRMEVIRAGYQQLFESYIVLALWTHQEIELRHAERVAEALDRLNSAREHDILLVLGSRGGQGRAAYDICVLCQSRAREKFVVVVPGRAKSAATLIALGADELHLGQHAALGPIDPQISDPPFPEVNDALEWIGALAQEYPESAAGYLSQYYVDEARQWERAGHIERSNASMVQDAETLMRRKTHLVQRAHEIAHELVHGYEDHGFDIDREHAAELLGTSWTKTQSNELAFSEQLHALLLVVEGEAEHRNQRIELVGAVEDGITIEDHGNE